MAPILLIDGNNLGHILGYIDKSANRYDSRGLLACLDGVSSHLASQGHEVEIVLFLDDDSAIERLGGWQVQIAPVPGGNADAAIGTYAQAHAGDPQILVSADRALCTDVMVWGVVCLPPRAFVSHYLTPARQAGFIDSAASKGKDWGMLLTDGEPGAEVPPEAQDSPPASQNDQGQADRQLLLAALERARAILHGKGLPVPEVYRLDLNHWADAAELALYLAEHHLCPDHPDLTDPNEMVVAIREHCCRQPRYFTSGRVVNRVFRLFLCRPEHTLSLDDLVQFSKTRRRKIRSAISRYGQRLGIIVAW